MESPHEPPAAKPWISRALVAGLFIWIAGFGILSLIRALSVSPMTKTIESPFKPWDGTWEGEFKTSKSTGELVKCVREKRVFRHVLADKDFRQEGHFDLADAATGKPEQELVLNIAEFDLSRPRRRVIKKMGQETAEYQGKIEEGRMVWSRSLAGVTETFREWIEGDEYLIEGTGNYGTGAKSETIVYSGRYRRVKPAEDKK